MQFISIGPRCNVKKQIDKHTKSCETNFFDWLSTNMDTVITVLNCEDINDILTYDNIIIDPNKPGTHTNSRMLIKSLPYCVSIHDIRVKFNDNDINNFLIKYKRRHQRMIEIIRSNKKLCFIRYEKVEDKHKEAFIQAILKINSNCNFTLVSINTKQDVYTVNKSDYFLEINLTYKPTENELKNDWTTSYLNWKSIFETINKLA